MKPLWTIDADANKEMILGEKFAPSVIEQGAVGLDGVSDNHTRLLVFLLQGKRFFKEIKSQNCRFAALPSEGYFRNIVSSDRLLDILFENFIRHPK